MADTSELQALLEFPNETTTIEHKSWLDLGQPHGKATLAKAALALCNEGGGIIVLGMREDAAQGGRLGSQPWPASLKRYNQDDINAAINRYADPQFHCELAFAVHPETGIEHAFIIVPGGMTVPVMSKSGCEGVIAQHRCYVRKPGPKSEEAFTSEEWRRVLERCMMARRETLLDAIRVIVQGHGDIEQRPERGKALTDFESAAFKEWTQLTSDLAKDHAARMPLGHYEIAFEILDVPSAGSASELLERMKVASTVKHTGWEPFVQLMRPEFEPHVVDGNIEAWVRPTEERLTRHYDFWRANPSGLFYLLRGYDEDRSERVRPGTMIDVTLPIWRVGEVLLYASRIARLFGENPVVAVRCHYTGLRNRQLGALDPLRQFFMNEGRVCHDAEARLSGRATASELEDNLVEILHPLLIPLYERFGFFQLSVDLVQTEVARFKGNRF